MTKDIMSPLSKSWGRHDPPPPINSVPARGDCQKNEVITFSRDAKINTAGSTFSGELQTGLLIGFAKQKRKL